MLLNHIFIHVNTRQPWEVIDWDNQSVSLKLKNDKTEKWVSSSYLLNENIWKHVGLGKSNNFNSLYEKLIG